MTGWEAATFEGLERIRAADLVRTTPQQRLAWLDEALKFAYASGALARAREDKQREIDRIWSVQAQVADPSGAQA